MSYNKHAPWTTQKVLWNPRISFFTSIELYAVNLLQGGGKAARDMRVELSQQVHVDIEFRRRLVNEKLGEKNN